MSVSFGTAVIQQLYIFTTTQVVGRAIILGAAVTGQQSSQHFGSADNIWISCYSTAVPLPIIWTSSDSKAASS
jgi:hypothetical protein